MKGLTDGVQQDFPIWKNKVHRARPVLCEADTYLAEFRQVGAPVLQPVRADGEVVRRGATRSLSRDLRPTATPGSRPSATATTSSRSTTPPSTPRCRSRSR